MLGNKKWVAIAVVLLCAMLFASAMPLLESFHDCCGEDCQVCQVFFAFHNLVNSLKTTLVALVAFAVVLAIVLTSSTAKRRSHTPVSDNIKLSE